MIFFWYWDRKIATWSSHLPASAAIQNGQLQNVFPWTISWVLSCINWLFNCTLIWLSLLDFDILLCLRAGGIMFSGCPSVRPSVRSLKYPLLTCTWVRWATRPTVTVLRHVCPSVRPSVRLSIRPSVRPSGEVSGHLPENAWREWPEILHADVSWPSSELISLWPWSVDFSNFGAILT